MEVRWSVRIDPDPGRVPAPARQGPARGASFRDRLANVEPRPAAQRDADSRRAGPRPEDTGSLPAEPQPPGAEDPSPRAAAGSTDTGSGDRPAHAPAGRTAAAELSGKRDTTGRGDPGRRVTAGKGPGSPAAHTGAARPGAALPSGAPRIELSAANAVNHGAVAGTAGSAAATTPQLQPGAAQPTAEGRLAAVEALSEVKRAASVRAAQAGFRTLGPQNVRLLEMARDSVFKQIAFRLHGGGGEMRVRLDPPQLGELDMHLLVEKGGALRLSITAERPEMAMMLDKHMLELQKALQQSGLQVVHAEVHERQRDGGGAFPSGAESWNGAAGAGEPDDGAPAILPRRGYIHAEGLDFWV